MATKIDMRSQPRDPADGTGEVTLVLLREQFQHSFVPRMSEDGTEIPIPVTPVALVARIFADHRGDALAEETIVGDIERYRAEWSDRVWLLREKMPRDIWNAAKELLLLRRFITGGAGLWLWNPADAVLRDFYANSLLTYEEVKRRGWPERAILADEALTAAAAAAH